MCSIPIRAVYTYTIKHSSKSVTIHMHTCIYYLYTHDNKHMYLWGCFALKVTHRLQACDRLSHNMLLGPIWEHYRGIKCIQIFLPHIFLHSVTILSLVSGTCIHPPVIIRYLSYRTATIFLWEPCFLMPAPPDSQVVIAVFTCKPRHSDNPPPHLCVWSQSWL